MKNEVSKLESGFPAADLTYTPAWKLAELVRSKKLSPVEITEHFLNRIEIQNHQLHSYITVCPEQAIEQARLAEASAIAGEFLGDLHGVPIAIKDLNMTKGLRTTRGSLLFKDWIPDQDDIVVERIRAAGAIILGKTNTPEFGWKGTTENLLGDPCRNPWNTSMTSGGSSGGAASAMAAGLCPLANGSDAGGSIRIPSSFCGVFGIKPTKGRVPNLYESKGGWQSISQNGPIANNVLDAALLLSVLAGPDPRDPTCIDQTPPDFIQSIKNPSLRGIRIVWSPTLGNCPVDPQVQSLTALAVQQFADLGAEVDEMQLEISPEELVRVWSMLVMTDMSLGLGPTANIESEMLPDALLSWLTQAANWKATQYASALHSLEWHRMYTHRLFKQYDLLLTPTTAVPAFPIGEPPHEIDNQEVDPRWGFTPFCSPFNLSGNPAASIPCGLTSNNLPVGLQVVGGVGADSTVLKACAAFELVQPWNNRRPPVQSDK